MKLSELKFIFLIKAHYTLCTLNLIIWRYFVIDLNRPIREAKLGEFSVYFRPGVLVREALLGVFILVQVTWLGEMLGRWGCWIVGSG